MRRQKICLRHIFSRRGQRVTDPMPEAVINFFIAKLYFLLQHRKNLMKNNLIIVCFIIIFTSAFFILSFQSKEINCTGNITFIKGKEKLSLIVGNKMDDGKGFITLSGTLDNGNNESLEISKKLISTTVRTTMSSLLNPLLFITTQKTKCFLKKQMLGFLIFY